MTFKAIVQDKLPVDPQLDFCRCFGGMDKTGREIALCPPGLFPIAPRPALHKSFWGSPSFPTAIHNVPTAEAT